MRLTLNNFDFKAMGSPCSIRVFAANAQVAVDAIAAAVTEINRLEIKFSRYKDNNLMYQVNAAAASGGSIAVDEEFISLFEFAQVCYEQSDGLFDITSGTLRKIWNFDKQNIPSAERVAEVLASIGWQHVSWQAKTVSFAKPDMELDFGGLVKEYAVDSAARILREQGIQYGLIDLGGDMFAIGPHPDGTPWTIHIRHPRKADSHCAAIQLKHGALASSGDYERYIDLDGKRYSHILSPKTGWPVSGMAAVSVVAQQCIVAGSTCTIAMLKELAAPAWLDELGLPHLWIDINGDRGGTKTLDVGI